MTPFNEGKRNLWPQAVLLLSVAVLFYVYIDVIWSLYK